MDTRFLWQDLTPLNNRDMIRNNEIRALFLCLIIGIKHDFLCINICWAPREALKPESERRVFQLLFSGQANVNVSENHVWSLLLHRNIFSLDNFGDSEYASIFFLYLQWHANARYLGTASRAQTNVLVTSLFYACYRARYWCWRHLLRWPRNTYFKTAKQGYDSAWIALLKYGFAPVKTWLLIASGTGFMQ